MRLFRVARLAHLTRRRIHRSADCENTQELELIAFEQNQIEQFAQVWFAGEPDAAVRFLSLLKAHPAIRGLARIPLMLSLLSRMFTAKPVEAFPQTRCEIYEQCLRGLLKDWKEEKQPGIEIENADAMLEALSALAFVMPIEQGAFNRSFLRKQMLQWLGELHPSDSFYGRLTGSESVKSIDPWRPLVAPNDVCVAIPAPGSTIDSIATSYQKGIAAI